MNINRFSAFCISKSKISITVFFLVFLFFANTVKALYNEASEKSSQDIIYKSDKGKEGGFFLRKILHRFVENEKARLKKFEEYISDNKDFSPVTAISIFFMVFFIGFIRLLAPGSGKIYAAGYFISRDLPLVEIIKYSYKAMFIHVGFSFIVYDMLTFGLKTDSFVSFGIYGKYILIISSLLLFVLGLFLFFDKMGYAAGKIYPTIHKKTPGSLYLLMFFTGISPCFLIPTLNTICADVNVIYVFFMLAGFACGMSAGMCVFLMLAVTGKRLLITIVSGASDISSPFKTMIEIAALLIMTFAALIFTIFNIVNN